MRRWHVIETPDGSPDAVVARADHCAADEGLSGIAVDLDRLVLFQCRRDKPPVYSATVVD